MAHNTFGLPSDIKWWREEARHMLRSSACARCHIPPGISGALKIFDLDKVDWAGSLTDDQLSQIKWRVDINDDEVRAFGSDPKKHQLLKNTQNL